MRSAIGDEDFCGGIVAGHNLVEREQAFEAEICAHLLLSLTDLHGVREEHVGTGEVDLFAIRRHG